MGSGPVAAAIVAARSLPAAVPITLLITTDEETTKQGALDQMVDKQDQEILLAALKDWGALDGDHTYAKGLEAGERRGFVSDPGGGLNSVPIAGKRIEMSALLRRMEDTPRAATCSHGRPTVLKLSKADIEKMFGRR